MTFRRIVVITLCLQALPGSRLWADEAISSKQTEVKLPEAQKKELSIEDLLKRYREKVTLSSFKDALDKKVAAQSAVDSRLSPGPWTLGVLGERATSEGGDTKVDFIAKRKIALGNNRDSVDRRYRFEANAELLSKRRDAREQEFEVAKLFTQLKQRQGAFRVNSDTLARLEALETKAKAAVRLGTLGGLFATRLKLVVNSVRSDLLHEKNAYILQAKALSIISGIELPSDPADVKLIGRDLSSQLPQLSEESFLPSAPGLARQQALAAQATQISGIWEIEVGLGLTHNFESKKQGIIFEVDIPLGTESAANSEAKALVSEQAVLKAEGQFILARAREKAQLLKTNVDSLSDAVRIEATHITDLESLLKTTESAFRTGQSEIAEILETSKELHEANIKITELSSELEEAALALDYFAGGDLL